MNQRSTSLEHPWDVTPKEAIAIQERLHQFLLTEDQLRSVQHVAGIDIGFLEGNTVTRAAVAVLNFPSLELAEHVIVHQPTTFPYIPGLLSFREAPAALSALKRLTIKPDLLLCDGQGLAHPRRLGLACHIGLLCDIPSIGVAKKRLVGKHVPVEESRGSRQPLWDKSEKVGVVLRTRDRVKPLFVSVGHRISLESAVDYVMACTPKYRLPETTRHAHRLASGSTREGHRIYGTQSPLI